MNKKKQLECQLECRATASLKGTIQADLHKPDQPLKDLLKEQDVTEETEDNECNDS